MLRRTVGVIAVGLMAVALPACGSDNRLTKSELVSKLNALCKDRNTDTKFLDETNIFDPKLGAPAFTRALETFRTFIDDVEALDPPKADQALIDGYVKDGRAALDGVTKGVAGAEAGDARTYFKHLAPSFNTFTRIDASLADYGAKSCRQDEGASIPEDPDPQATTVNVSAHEYTFEVPGGIRAGRTALVLTNTGNEMHFMGVSKLKAGVTPQQFIDQVNGGQEGGPELAEDPSGESGVAGPDLSVALNLDLVPGTYMIACWIPDAEGTPHANKGMLVPFTVT